MIELKKTEKTIRAEHTNGNILFSLYCTQCEDHKCLHIIELIEKLEVKQ